MSVSRPRLLCVSFESIRLVLDEKVSDDRVLKSFLVWNVVVLECPPYWFPSAQNQEVEFDQLSDVIGHPRERLACDASCFSRAERMTRDDYQK